MLEKLLELDQRILFMLYRLRLLLTIFALRVFYSANVAFGIGGQVMIELWNDMLRQCMIAMTLEIRTLRWTVIK